MAYLTLRGINKIYPNGFHAVHDFNLEIEKGEFIVFVGSSGCGKSTTLRMIAGLENISKGDFYIDGEKANDMGPRERGVAMVFQSYALYPHMTVYDNLAFGLTLQGVDDDVIEERVLASAKILGLTDYLDRMPRELSGGQRQRVAVGRAIIRKVDIFLMDEPLSNLDAKQRVTMRSEISQIHRETGATTIYVTHDQTEAMTMADRIVVMRNGYIQQVGTPYDLYFNPVNLFVAQFLGTPQINTFKGRVENGWLHIGEDKVLKTTGISDREVYAGVRPEGFILYENGPLHCRLSAVEVMGRDTSVVSFNDNMTGVSIRSIISAENKVDTSKKEVRFFLKPYKVHIFSMEDEKRLYFEEGVLK